ncbi:MAG: shikimate kinase [Planctomycetia bacterium]|nr:shikimate kinase [Planctomycetia bacterium]
MPILTLIGYRGTGKSTVARLVAERLGAAWVDADAVLEERVGCSIVELVRQRGEPAFRDAEEEVLAGLVAARTGVLATGGGVVLREANRRLLRARARPVVWLTASVETLKERISADPESHGRRPALLGCDVLAEVEEAVRDREPLYRACADLAVDTTSLAPQAVALGIADWLATSAGRADAGGPSR